MWQLIRPLHRANGVIELQLQFSLLQSVGWVLPRITAKALMVAQQGSKANMAPVLSKPCTSKGWPFVACMLGGPTRRCEHPHLTSHKFQNMAGQAVRFHNS